MTGETFQEPMFGLVVPVGLFHGAAPGIDRADGTPRSVGALLVGLGVLLLVDLLGLQVGKFFVTDVLEHQGLCAIANEDPFALGNFYSGHGTSWDIAQSHARRTMGAAAHMRFD